MDFEFLAGVGEVVIHSLPNSTTIRVDLDAPGGPYEEWVRNAALVVGEGHVGLTGPRPYKGTSGPKITLTVPEYSEVVVEIGSGNIVTTGSLVNAYLLTESGNVNVAHLSGDHNTVRTADGDVTVGSSSGMLEASATDGNIHAAGISGRAKLSAPKGGVRVVADDPSLLAVVVRDGSTLDISGSYKPENVAVFALLTDDPGTRVYIG
ncbi:DUF4097 family beta strand repeat-containing protein [Actinomadura scrupuli]|uniref:DUF4097 family beta strand repeat-containing protein n=1 Tax=Actinomadura scrupuli TaxID=559629 RepID=UPI003D98D38A